MSNLVIEKPEDYSIEKKFGTLRDIVVDSSEKGTYHSDIVKTLSKLAEDTTSALADIQKKPPSDRGFETEKLGNEKANEVQEHARRVSEAFDLDIEGERKALHKYDEPGPNDQEIRENFNAVRDDPVALQTVVQDFTDREFNALRMGPRKVVVNTLGAPGTLDNSRVTIVPSIPKKLEESELRRRRPNTALRINLFTRKKAAHESLANSLRSMIVEATNPLAAHVR